MKYQIIQHNKSGTKLLGAYRETFSDALAYVRTLGRYEGLSYVGSFPMFRNEKGRLYTIQGSVEIGVSRVVCSLDKKELEAAGLVA